MHALPGAATAASGERDSTSFISLSAHPLQQRHQQQSVRRCSSTCSTSPPLALQHACRPPLTLSQALGDGTTCALCAFLVNRVKLYLNDTSVQQTIIDAADKVRRGALATCSDSWPSGRRDGVICSGSNCVSKPSRPKLVHHACGVENASNRMGCQFSLLLLSLLLLLMLLLLLLLHPTAGLLVAACRVRQVLH